MSSVNFFASKSRQSILYGFNFCVSQYIFGPLITGLHPFKICPMYFYIFILLVAFWVYKLNAKSLWLDNKYNILSEWTIKSLLCFAVGLYFGDIVVKVFSLMSNLKISRLPNPTTYMSIKCFVDIQQPSLLGRLAVLRHTFVYTSKISQLASFPLFSPPKTKTWFPSY